MVEPHCSTFRIITAIFWKSEYLGILQYFFIKTYMSHDIKKPVFSSFRPARHKPACAATEASKSLEISAIESNYIILSKQRTTKALIRLRRCAGWSAPLLFAYDIRHIFSWRGSHVCCRYSLELLPRDDSVEYQQHIFMEKCRKLAFNCHQIPTCTVQ